MLPKPGKDLKTPINHRPISLINIMSKILENNFFSQQAENPHHTQNSSRIVWIQITALDNIKNGLNLRHRTAATFLGIEKAFN